MCPLKGPSRRCSITVFPLKKERPVRTGKFERGPTLDRNKFDGQFANSASQTSLLGFNRLVEKVQGWVSSAAKAVLDEQSHKSSAKSAVL